jgi:hypothetical protein
MHQQLYYRCRHYNQEYRRGRLPEDLSDSRIISIQQQQQQQ